MAESIEREARYIDINKISIPKGFFNDLNVPKLFDWLNSQPAADVVEVKHGEWVLESRIYKMFDDVDEEFYVECPFCQRTFYIPFELEEEKMLAYAKEHYPYCNCGAKMN